MEPWVLWLIAAAILGIGEIATMGFFLAPFAAGALVAALLSAAGAGTAISLIVFLLVSIAALAALRPIARSHRKMPALSRTGTAAARSGRRAPTTKTRSSSRDGAYRSSRSGARPRSSARSRRRS